MSLRSPYADLEAEPLHEAAALEYDDGRARPDLVARCQAEADGDPDRTRALYIEARLDELVYGPAPPSSEPTSRRESGAVRAQGPSDRAAA